MLIPSEKAQLTKDATTLPGSNEMANAPILVTKPCLPPLKDFMPYLEEIWEKQWLTNGGPFHQRLEEALAEYMAVDHLALTSNGTVALSLALRALDVHGEVITTPFTFVATAHSLLWNGNDPVFVDVQSDTCNMDPSKIEAAITPRTSAIMPVHCYGNPCDVEQIQAIADAHGLKVIYDGAHAFGVFHGGKSLVSHGDMATLSFHATKVFSTFEGGAIVCKTAEQKREIDLLKNFGIVDEISVTAAGINGKMNEIQAAFGLLQLPHIEETLDHRRRLDAIYRDGLSDIPGIRLLPVSEQTTRNGSYFPIMVGDDFPMSRDELYLHLKTKNIFSRRYFYPLISTMPMYQPLPSAATDNLPIASRLAAEVLCLPIYPQLSADDQQRVIECILSVK